MINTYQATGYSSMIIYVPVNFYDSGKNTSGCALELREEPGLL